MIRLHSSCFYVVLLCIVGGVLAVQNGGFYNCTPWEDGEKVTITYFIDHDKFPSECTGTPDGKPKFRMSINSTIDSSINCTVRSDIKVSGNCNFATGTLGCGCTDGNVTIASVNYYRTEYNFIAGPDYQRWWEMSITCVDSTFKAALSFSQTGCQPIPNVPTTPTTTTTAGTTEQTTVKDDPDSSDAGRIAGGVVGGISAVLVGCGVAAFAVYKSKKNRAGTCNNATTNAPPAANGDSCGTTGTAREKPPINSTSDNRDQ